MSKISKEVVDLIVKRMSTMEQNTRRDGNVVSDGTSFSAQLKDVFENMARLPFQRDEVGDIERELALFEQHGVQPRFEVLGNHPGHTNFILAVWTGDEPYVSPKGEKFEKGTIFLLDGNHRRQYYIVRANDGHQPHIDYLDKYVDFTIYPCNDAEELRETYDLIDSNEQAKNRYDALKGYQSETGETNTPKGCLGALVKSFGSMLGMKHAPQDSKGMTALLNLAVAKDAAGQPVSIQRLYNEFLTLRSVNGKKKLSTLSESAEFTAYCLLRHKHQDNTTIIEINNVFASMYKTLSSTDVAVLNNGCDDKIAGCDHTFVKLNKMYVKRTEQEYLTCDSAERTQNMRCLVLFLAVENYLEGIKFVKTSRLQGKTSLKFLRTKADGTVETKNSLPTYYARKSDDTDDLVSSTFKEFCVCK